MLLHSGSISSAVVKNESAAQKRDLSSLMYAIIIVWPRLKLKRRIRSHELREFANNVHSHRFIGFRMMMQSRSIGTRW